MTCCDSKESLLPKKKEVVVREELTWHTGEPPHSKIECQYLVYTEWSHADKPYTGGSPRLEQMFFIYDFMAGCWHWETTKNQKVVAWSYLPVVPSRILIGEYKNDNV